MDAKGRTRLGIDHFNAGRHDRAILCFRGALASGDRAPETSLFLAHALDSAGRPREAARVLGALLEKRPGHVPASLALAGLLERAPREAWTLRASKALRSRDPRVRKALAAILRSYAEAAVAAGRWTEAEDILRRAPKREARADLASALAARARAELRAGRAAQAERTFRRAAALAPADAPLRREFLEVRRARAAARQKRAKAEFAARSAAKAEKIRRLSELRKALAESLLARGEPRRALKLLPDDARIRRALVEDLRARARSSPPAAAGKALREALRLEPGDAEARRELAEALRARAWAHESAGRLAPAEALLREASALDPAAAELGRRLAATLREREPAGVPGSIEALRLREKLERVEGRLRAREKTLELLLEAAPERSIDRFRALMNLRRYGKAIDEAELILDGGARQPEFWGLSNPWDWEEWTSRTSRQRQLVRDLKGRLAAPARRPWLLFYRVVLKDPGGLDDFDLAALPRDRYGWMHLMAGRTCLIEGPVPTAARWLTIAAERTPPDWRANAFLAEAHLVLGRREAAYAEMERARLVAPPADESLLLAWRAAFDLWLGDYAQALALLDRACTAGSPHAFCWRGAALLKLGRAAEAVEALDLALSRFPGDLEAYLWRAEAKRTLGLHDQALEDLRRPPLGVWVLVNRALAKAALGDLDGMKADHDALPRHVVERVRAALGPEPAGEARVLEECLRLARGWRREEYGQSLWLPA